MTLAVGQIVNNHFLGNEVFGGAHAGGGTGGDGIGGGLMAYQSISKLAHNTFYLNAAMGGSGSTDGTASGLAVSVGTATVTASNNVLWTGLPSDQDVVVSGSICEGSGWSSSGYNLVESTGDCTFDGPGEIVGNDPSLTFAAADTCATTLIDGTCPQVGTPPQSSLAVDQGSCVVSGVGNDARSVARPYNVSGVADADDGCDIGAVEFDGNSSGGGQSCVDCDVEDPGLLGQEILF